MKHNFEKYHRGFTLIEILVVIGIVAILSALILISVRNAQIKTKNAAAETYMNQLKRIIDTKFLDKNYYEIGGDRLCADATNLNTASADLSKINAGLVASGSSVQHCYANDTRYCVQVTLADSSTKWCIDYKGNIGSNVVNCRNGARSCD